ncbi:M3 family metallopeptidase [Actinomyces sp. F1_1611]
MTNLLPDFSTLTLDQIEADILAGMEEQRAQWEEVATNPEAPTVANTLVALDESGARLDRAGAIFWTLASSIGGDELDRLQEKLVPLLTEHSNTYLLDERLYRRFLELSDPDPQTQWEIAEQIRAFEQHGIACPDKEQLRRLNVRIAELETEVDQRISKQLEETGLSVTDEAELAGLDEATRAGYRRDHDWFIRCRNFSTQLDQSVLEEPRVRRALLEVSVTRGRTGSTDTRALIVELTQLRSERAHLLGFPDHATVVMQGETIPGPDAAQDLLVEVGRAARARVDEDAQKLRQLCPDLEAADWPFYENQLRAQELGFDAESLRPYLELNRILTDGVFYAANRLYGITLTERPDLRGWHEDVRVWEVKEEDGTALGLFLGDYFTRPGKSGGAWMSELQEAHPASGQLPIITNDANFTKPAPGQPLLLTWDDVETLFHEFGHALHGLFSDTKYRDSAGTNVPRDFVELPSQLNEMWAFHPEVLSRYARHYQTGEPLPADLLAAVVGSKSFGQGFATLEYVEAALIDQAWHREGTLPTEADQVPTFEVEALERLGLWHDLVPPRYRSTYFAHTFAGGYDAGYYAYMWAETLAAEVEEWFRAQPNGGLTREAGEKLRRELLSRGNSRPPLDSFRAVTGKDASAQSVLRRRGLV